MKLFNVVMVVLVAIGGMYLYKKYRVPPTIAFPELSLVDLEGKAVKLADFNKKHIFLNFYATWCAPCRQEMPDLVSASKKLAGDNILFIAVSDESIDKINRFRGKNESPILFLQMNGKREDVGVHTIPTSYLITKSGKVVYEKVGVEDWDSETMLNKMRDLAGS